MQLSQKHAEEKKKCIEEVTGDFFGKFTAISHVSILVGTLFMSVVFESAGINHDHMVEKVDGEAFVTEEPLLEVTEMDLYGTTLLAANESVYTTIKSAQSDFQCGLFYKFADVKVEEHKVVGEVVMYVLLATYLACNLVAALLCFCLDEVKGIEPSQSACEALCTSLQSLHGNGINGYDNRSPDEERLSNNNSESKKKKTSTFDLIKSTLRLLATDKAAWLLIPFTLHYGMIQGFTRGVYNASWITCALGKYQYLNAIATFLEV